MDLISENERLINELKNKNEETEKMKISLARLKYYEVNNTFYGHFDTRCLMESQLRELENANRFLMEEKQKIEVLYKVLVERHSDTSKNLNTTEKELDILQRKMSDEVGALDSKLSKLHNDLEKIQKENKSLRISEEKLRQEKHHSDLEREKYNSKYLNYKEQFQSLSCKMNNVSL